MRCAKAGKVDSARAIVMRTAADFDRPVCYSFDLFAWVVGGREVFGG